MAKVIPITEHFQHFVEELKDSFWGDLQGEAQRTAKRFFERLSEQQRDRYMGDARYVRSAKRKDHRNGYYLRDFVTRFGTLRLRIARSRKRGFLPAVMAKFQRRAEEVCLLIREAFLRGISTRQVGRVVGVLTGEVVSAQTVSQLTRDLDEAVRQFHQARLEDQWAYLFLDGVSLRVRRPSGRQRVHMLVAYGVRRDGSRQLLAFLRSNGESQSAWEGLLGDLYRRGLRGQNLLLIVTDGCPGLAAAIPTVYPRALHQRCWVHKMRNILERVRKRDYDEVKKGAQAIMGPRVGARPKPPFVLSVVAGSAITVLWCVGWSAICRNCSRFFTSPGTCGRSYAPPTSLSVVSSRCAAALAPWFALSTFKAWTESFTPSSSDLTWNGKPAPSSYLHKQLDITFAY